MKTNKLWVNNDAHFRYRLVTKRPFFLLIGDGKKIVATFFCQGEQLKEELEEIKLSWLACPIKMNFGTSYIVFEWWFLDGDVLCRQVDTCDWVHAIPMLFDELLIFATIFIPIFT